MIQTMELTNTDRAFYPTMGPFLANREVHKALGGVPWDDDTKTWFVVKDTRKGVLGFCAVAVHGTRTVVESLWVQDGMNRVASELVGAAVTRFGKQDLHAKVRRSIVPAYADSGFIEVETGSTKEFAHLTRKASTRG